MAGEDVAELEGRHPRRQIDSDHPQEGEPDPMVEEKPCPVSLDQKGKEEEEEGEEGHDRSFEDVERPGTIRKELGKGVWGDAPEPRPLLGVVRAVATEGGHLDRPEKCHSHQ